VTEHESGRETVAIVVVTYNRAGLLLRMLGALAASQRRPDASTDHTKTVLDGARDAHSDLPLQVIRPETNLGGAGGFHLGVEAAYEQGFERIWLMDDDVLPAPDCLGVLMDVDEDCLMAVREDTSGHLVEKAAVTFDLRNPLRIKPKTAMVETTYGERAAMPDKVELENVAFEGFMVRRRVVEQIGLPDPDFFIFYDDVDYALRARRAGFRIWAVRDAVLVRQLGFDQQHDLGGWKGYYMYRNLFTVHRRYGENRLVRAKPWLITAGVVALSPLRGGQDEVRNVSKALKDSRAHSRGDARRP
jgi:rhamnopyranosyl-N-acetylglucosaminyl-diphospho-decaprenol beta-1,3/1,4-galactofuranosyltransferase